MALSMPWMRFLEESYHLAAGETLMKAIAVAGILDGGNFGIEDLQQTLNMWYPRRSEEHTSELQSPCNLVCRLLLEKKKHTPDMGTALQVRRLRTDASRN